jgi:hypothetical protein
LAHLAGTQTAGNLGIAFQLRLRQVQQLSEGIGMANDFHYDVFLSHSSKDKAVVRPLAERVSLRAKPARDLRVRTGHF